MGSSWEGDAIEALLAAAPGAGVSFYRTAAGAEVDLVLELGGSRGSWAVEIKRGLDPGVSKGLRNACADLRPTRTFVVYSGTEGYPLTTDVEAIGLRELAAQLRTSE